MGDLFLSLTPDLLLALCWSRPKLSFPSLPPPPSRLADLFLGEGDARFLGLGDESTGLGSSFFSSGLRPLPAFGLVSFFDFFFFLLSLSLLESEELELESELDSLEELLELLDSFRFFLSFLSFSLLLPFLSSPLLSELESRLFLLFFSSSGFAFSSCAPAPAEPGAMLFK